MDNSLFLPILILVLIGILFLLVNINSKKIDVNKKKKVLEDLASLYSQTSSDDNAVRRDVVIKLDNILSKSLQMYYKNDESCGNNLKSAKSIFKKRRYNSLWDVHKLRNKVVHNDYVPSVEETKKAYEVYKISIMQILK
jgi:hypothetical protein